MACLTSLSQAPAAGIKSGRPSSEDKDDGSSMLLQVIQEHGLTLNDDGYVRWGNLNAKHPRNWAPKRKAYNTTVILLLEFVT